MTLLSSWRRITCGLVLTATALTPAALAVTSRPPSTAQEVVERMIAAHGGLERWRAAPSVAFDNVFFNPAAMSVPASPWWVSREVIEPRSRSAYHDWPLDGARLAWDGERVWSTGWRQANRPTFQALFFFYFLNLPWLTQDDNVRLGAPERVSVPGVEGEMIAVEMTFTEAPAPGKSERDSFRLFIDPDTWLLRAYEYTIGWEPMLRSMSVPEGRLMGPVLRINDTYATVDGFVVPTSMHTTSPDGSQTFGYHAILNYSFTEPFDESRLRMPENGVIDFPAASSAPGETAVAAATMPVSVGSPAAAPAVALAARVDTVPGGANGSAAPGVPPACEPDAGPLALPPGFCAWKAADGIAGARQLIVTPRGDVLVAAFGESGIWALRDGDDDGVLEDRRRLTDRPGHGLRMHDGYLYWSDGSTVVRYPFDEEHLELGAAETILTELPQSRHGAKSFVIRGDDLFINFGAPSNSCQEEDRAEGSPGVDPCPELETHAGIWKFSATMAGQTGADGRRYATGLRHAVALADGPDGALYAVIHGRDRLFQSWPGRFDAGAGAELPSEELVRIDEGDDFGWPYCFHDPVGDRKLLAPEYGGDGVAVGRCAEAEMPIYGFPAHWAPNGMLFYEGEQFPARYRDGVFVAFHGSWNRAPMPQGGYNVSFLPLREGRASAPHEVFAAGFGGATPTPESAPHRPVDLAEGPDGSLYLSDDTGGTIWRIAFGEAPRSPTTPTTPTTPRPATRRPTTPRSHDPHDLAPHAPVTPSSPVGCAASAGAPDRPALPPENDR